MLFFSQLPPDISRRDLKAFIRAELRAAGVRGSPLLPVCSSCTLLRITDPGRGTTEHRGLVEVQPARIAIQVIEALNGKVLRGYRIEVRRYRHRSPWVQRRFGSEAHGHGDADLVAQPLSERRRANLKVELVESTAH